MNLWRPVVSDGHLEAAFDGLGAAIGKEGKLEIAGRDEGDEVREVSAQRVDQFLRVDALPVELVENSFENFRVPVAGDVDAEAAEHVDEFLAVDVLEACAFVGPFDGGVIGRDGFPVLEEAGVDVVGPILDGLFDDALAFSERQFLLAD